MYPLLSPVLIGLHLPEFLDKPKLHISSVRFLTDQDDLLKDIN